MKDRQKSTASPNKSEAAHTIHQMVEKWPSTFVPRSKVGEFSGGLYSRGYLANQDSAGTGPEGRFRVGRETVYPVYSLCEWLVARVEM